MKINQRIEYLDCLRALATLSVILFHVMIYNDTLESIISYVFNFCVPIFLMISGALFFEKNINTKIMIRKYMLHIVGVIIIWGSVYNLISNILINGFSFQTIIKSYLMIFTADLSYCYHFWYLYLLFGLYLIIPLLKPWVDIHMNGEKPDKECIIVFSVLTIVSIVVPSVANFFGFAVSDIWCGAFVPFSGFVFYLLCGYWIRQWGLNRILVIIFSSIFSIISFVAIICWICGNLSLVNSFSGYISLPVWSISLILFGLIKKISFNKMPYILRRIQANIAIDSLGIYVFHVMYIMLFQKLMTYCSFSVKSVWFSVSQFFFAFLLSIFTTRLVKRIPLIKNFI